MPRFFFNIYNDMVAIDEEGVELPDLEAARAEAIRGARSLISDAVVTQGRLNLKHRIEVEDEERRPVFMLPFGSAIELEE